MSLCLRECAVMVALAIVVAAAIPGAASGQSQPIQGLVQDVPQYSQGSLPICGPTAAGMVIGYWDQFCPTLVLGDASTQTLAVQEMIDEISLNMLVQSKTLMPEAMMEYATLHGMPSIAGWAWYEQGLTSQRNLAVAIRASIDADCPSILYTSVQGQSPHFMVIDGYTGVRTYPVTWKNPGLYPWVLTSLQTIDPVGGLPTDVTWPTATDFPIRDVMFFWPLSKVLTIPLNLSQGGTFDSQDDLGLYTVGGGGGQNQAEVTLLPGTTDNSVLALTSAGSPVSISQEALLAAGNGFVLSFDYELPPDSKLELLLNGVLLDTLTATTDTMTAYQLLVDTEAMDLDRNSDQELTLRFSAANDPTLYIDNLSAVVQPVPEPATFFLLALGGMGLIPRGRRSPLEAR